MGEPPFCAKNREGMAAWDNLEPQHIVIALHLTRKSLFPILFALYPPKKRKVLPGKWNYIEEGLVVTVTVYVFYGKWEA